MIKNRFNYCFCLSALFLFLYCSLSAQTIITSPYSRFGIGDLTANANAWNFSMGGTSIGLRSPYHISFINPASYTAFDSTSFVFEGGIIFNYVQLKTNLQSASRTYASVGYLTFGFPVTKWWKTTLGLLPYSNVGYNVSSDAIVPEVGRVTRIYSGSGGINRFLWGNGFKLTKNFSIGINASYLFGSMVRESASTFPDSSFYLNFREDNNITVSGLYFDYGIQYTAKLKKDVRLTAGAIFGTNSNVNAKTDHLSTTYFESGGNEYTKDTIKNEPGLRGTITVPLMFGLGLSFEKPDKWLIGADYRWQNWQKYQAFGMSDSLVNSYYISAGVELVPDYNNYTNYLKRIRYRLGLKYNSTYLQLRQKHLNEYAVTLGFGLPIRGMKTAINLGAELGTRGTTQSNLIQETYFNFVVGFSIYERWFVKRKYF
jgi:long-subunit fatty acid transport protein